MLTRAALREGARWLADTDPDLAAVLARVGTPPLWARRPGFPALVRIILEQQVSLAAARTMYRRIHARLGGITPESIHAVQASGLQALGPDPAESRILLRPCRTHYQWHPRSHRNGPPPR